MTLPTLTHYANCDEYHKILCPQMPDFLQPYLKLQMLQRLRGIGLLCGTDWTPLYKNRFFYSRYDHSVGTALIAWNFTHDKKQTLAALFHDIATPAFSHVNDFRTGDTLKQEATEEGTSGILANNTELMELLAKDGINLCDIDNYHIYPVCDNEVPSLSADRLEYMFPSGMALEGLWSLAEIKAEYNDISVLTNENGCIELGFSTMELAEHYCVNACKVGLVLQKNENKLALNLLGEILNKSLCKGITKESDFFTKSEKELLELFIKEAESNSTTEFASLLRTFLSMKNILHTDEAMPSSYCVNLSVKKRYINPLVKTGDKTARISTISKVAKDCVDYFLNFEDSKYGCVSLL